MANTDITADEKSKPVSATLADQEVPVVSNPPKSGKKELDKYKEVDDTKLVEVKIAQDVRCFIGTKEYKYERGQVVKVPGNVKRILERSGKLGVL